MKIILISLIFFVHNLFANYAYTNDHSGKIDMHGGKNEMMIDNKKSFSNSNLNNLGNIGITKPIVPIAPKTLIPEIKTDSQTKTTKEK